MKLFVGSVILLACSAIPVNVLAGQVWDGPVITITKQNFGSTVDSITENVSITRGDGQGLYNPVQEVQFTITSDGNGNQISSSPLGTLWAFEGLDGNPSGASFSAANYQNLTFNTWVESLGGFTQAGANIVNTPGVLYLTAEDIYIDVLFTSWTERPELGGGFSYNRSSAPMIAAEVVVPIPVEIVAVIFVMVMLIGITVLRKYQQSVSR